jgi:hypothetical protein
MNQKKDEIINYLIRVSILFVNRLYNLYFYISSVPDWFQFNSAIKRFVICFVVQIVIVNGFGIITLL